MEENKKKRALVAVAGLYRLYEAIYFTYLYSEYEWDIVILTYGKNDDVKFDMKKICERAKRFNNIYISNTVTQFSGLKTLLYECIKMGIAFITGQRKKYAEAVILKCVDKFDYDLLCMACSYSVFEGALLNFADAKKTIIMEEGLDDYVVVEKNYNLIMKIGAKILFDMQYINLLSDNNYRPLKYCEKYVSFPDRIRENTYMKINKLFDFSKVDKDKFWKTISDAFQLGDEEYDVVIYTSPLIDFSLETEYEEFEKRINYGCKGKKILLKRHPRDIYQYNFENLNVYERYTNIPGEIVLSKWKNAEHIFMYPSTILLSMNQDETRYQIIKFSSNNSAYTEGFDKLIDFLRISSDKLVMLEKR